MEHGTRNEYARFDETGRPTHRRNSWTLNLTGANLWIPLSETELRHSMENRSRDIAPRPEALRITSTSRPLGFLPCGSCMHGVPEDRHTAQGELHCERCGWFGRIRDNCGSHRIGPFGETFLDGSGRVYGCTCTGCREYDPRSPYRVPPLIAR